MHDRVLANRAPGSRPHSADRVYHHGHGHHHGGGQHDPFRNNKGAQAGSDVVDELLKPLQSYFSVFRTGQYQGGGHHGLLEENGHGPPAHNTRSHDKRYRIKRNQQEQGKARKGGEGGPENGHHGHPPPHLLPGGLPNMTGPPPPVANGYGPHSGPPPLLDVETEISHSMPPPNMAEPPPGMMAPPSYPPPHPGMLLLPPHPGPPPPVLGSPQAIEPSFTEPGELEGGEAGLSEEEQLGVDIGNMSLVERGEVGLENGEEMEEGGGEEAEQVEAEPAATEEEEAAPLQPPTKDLFNLFSLSFICKSKDVSERRIRLDFSLVAEVSEMGMDENDYHSHESEDTGDDVPF